MIKGSEACHSLRYRLWNVQEIRCPEKVSHLFACQGWESGLSGISGMDLLMTAEFFDKSIQIGLPGRSFGIKYLRDQEID
jgi:hypothetical protein